MCISFLPCSNVYSVIYFASNKVLNPNKNFNIYGYKLNKDIRNILQSGI